MTRGLTFSDPFGLRAAVDTPVVAEGPAASDEPSRVNWVKAAVGAVNVAIGSYKIAQGVTLLTAGTVTAPVLGISIPATALGTYQLASGTGMLNRGTQQLAEAGDNRAGASPRNLLGLLPFGQKFDDAVEPTPVQYFQGLISRFVEDPIASARQAVRDWLALGR